MSQGGKEWKGRLLEGGAAQCAVKESDGRRRGTGNKERKAGRESEGRRDEEEGAL